MGGYILFISQVGLRSCDVEACRPSDYNKDFMIYNHCVYNEGESLETKMLSTDATVVS